MIKTVVITAPMKVGIATICVIKKLLKAIPLVKYLIYKNLISLSVNAMYVLSLVLHVQQSMRYKDN